MRKPRNFRLAFPVVVDIQFPAVAPNGLISVSTQSVRAIRGVPTTLQATNLKGFVSSMKLHQTATGFGITQKGRLALGPTRIRETLAVTGNRFAGPVEVDETYIGGKERNKHNAKKLWAGRGPVGKTAVVGMKDRETGQIASQVIEAPTRLPYRDSWSGTPSWTLRCTQTTLGPTGECPAITKP